MPYKFNAINGILDLVNSSSITLGTTPITGATAGPVFFGGVGGTLQQDSTFFYDDTNNRLGIGTTAPALPLHVLGTNATPASSGTTATGTARFLSSSNVALDVGGYSTTPYGFWLQAHDQTNQATNYPILLNPLGGSVSVGDSSVASTVQFQVTAAAAGNKGVVVKAAVSQSANLQEWQNSSATVLASVSSAGLLRVADGTIGAPSISFTNVTGDGLFSNGSGSMGFATGGTGRMYLGATTLSVSSGLQFQWTSGAVDSTSPDTGIGRSAAGIVKMTNGAGVLGDGLASQLVLTQVVKTTGSPTALTLTGGAHTTLAASTEAIDANLNLARTVQFATGALTTQRAVVIQAPTYGFVGASTITGAYTFEITGAPIAGTNATLTESAGVRFKSGTAAGLALILQGAASRTAPILQLQTSAGASLGNVGGTIFNNFTDTASTSTDGTEDDLYSYTTVANTFAINGDSITQTEHAQFVASATATRRLKKYFAGTLVFDTGALTLSLGGDFILETTVIRESSTVVRVSVSAVTTSASSIPYATYTRITGLTLTGTNIIKTTGIAAGVGAASADILDKWSKIIAMPAA